MSKILVIDDEEGIRSVLSDILTDEGFDVITASDGKSGLALLEHHFVQLVILDVWLPDASGVDVLAAITKKNVGLPVVMISGHANMDIAVKAVNLGAYDFLEKPLSIDKLMMVVNNALEAYQLKAENRQLEEAINQVPEAIPQGKSLKDAMDVFEKDYILSVVKAEGSMEAAAVKLEITIDELEQKLKK